MPCFHPNVAFWYKPEYADSRPFGLERPMIMGPFMGLDYDYSVALHVKPELRLCLQQYLFPCGKCEGCRIMNMQQWTFRGLCELDKYPVSAFVTLTVDDHFMNTVFPGWHVSHRHFQLFMKRFRKRFPDIGVRYLMCAEYGTHSSRPHYHVVLFGWFPSDYVLLKDMGSYQVFTSNTLSDLWPYGFHTVSLANDRTIRYLVGYVMKKCDARFDKEYPPYLRVSTRPAIGLDFFEKYKSELFCKSEDLQFPNSFVFCGSSKSSLPRYFVKKYKQLADNADYVSLMKYRSKKLAEKKPLDKCDLERLEDYFREVTKASHDQREFEV